ncbi:group 1 glycosyl transferase [Corchorus olitorius]|uniref:Group 1 glycosyl transferase n=1 Tax=Corchorus olitorius TaxID=93759 RepID=A0A1R3JV76_9ROSI|nr:group 1 glycosyl transferase [Corchorus olitorius]
MEGIPISASPANLAVSCSAFEEETNGLESPGSAAATTQKIPAVVAPISFKEAVLKEEKTFFELPSMVEQKVEDDGYGAWMVVQSRKSKNGKDQTNGINVKGTSQPNRGEAEIQNAPSEVERVCESTAKQSASRALGLNPRETAITHKEVGQLGMGEGGFPEDTETSLGGSSASDFQPSRDSAGDADRHNPLLRNALVRPSVGDSPLDSNDAREFHELPAIRVPNERKRTGGGSSLNPPHGRVGARLRQVLVDARLRKSNAQGRSAPKKNRSRMGGEKPSTKKARNAQQPSTSINDNPSVEL